MSTNVTVSNFVPIDQAVVRYSRFSIFQDGGRPPSWICFTRVMTTNKEHLGGLCDCEICDCDRRSNSDSMQILMFCVLSLKMHIQATK